MSRFMIGDSVVCHVSLSEIGLHVGDTATITAVEYSEELGEDFVQTTTTGDAWLSSNRFEKEDNTKTKTANDAGETTSCTIDDTLKQRGSRYGTFKDHSSLSQGLSNCIRYHTTVHGKHLSDIHKEALYMICHKMARIVNGDPNYDDSWRDIAGYATLVVKHINGEDV